MPPTTITRSTWDDDSGTPEAPAGDGTTINNAALQQIYQNIDNMIAGALTVGGVLSSEGLGVTGAPHLFSATGAGHNIIRVRNSSPGTDRAGALELGTDADADLIRLEAHSSTYDTAPHGTTYQDGGVIRSMGAGGLGVYAENAAGTVVLGAGGTTQLATFDGDTIILSGGTPGTYALAGVLDRDSTQGGNAADTAYITRWTPTALPANTLDTDGQRLRIVAVGTTAANANTKHCRINFGSQAITFTYSGAGTSGGQWRIEAEVVRTGSSAQKIFSTAVYEGDGGNYNYTPSSNESYFETTEDLTASVTITVQVQSDGASANDTVYEYGYMEFWP